MQWEEQAGMCLVIAVGFFKTWAAFSEHFKMIFIFRWEKKRTLRFLYLQITCAARRSPVHHIHNCFISLNYSLHLFWEIHSVRIKTGQTQYEVCFRATCLNLILNASFFLSSPHALQTAGRNTADGSICKLCLRSHTVGGSHYMWASFTAFNTLHKHSIYLFVVVRASPGSRMCLCKFKGAFYSKSSLQTKLCKMSFGGEREGEHQPNCPLL